jgi:hypothetical protein
MGLSPPANGQVVCCLQNRITVSHVVGVLHGYVPGALTTPEVAQPESVSRARLGSSRPRERVGVERANRG